MLQLSIHLFDGRMAMGLLSDYFFIHSTVDIISAIEFDKTGDHLATGDRGGRVVLFERTDTKDVRSFYPFMLLLFFLDVNFVILPYCLLFLTTIKYFIYHNISMEDPEGIWRGWTIQQVGILSFVIRQSFRAMNLRYSRWMSNFYMYFRSACWIWNSCTHTLSECHISV